ncbi:hypothetical protein VKT23_020449 [Stygiomarasmius scandens]|uniref:Heterokaryon incompatibility domain-containing protein n=1 Tax=Marasmiellus scandens TaxID=2682957 RepID=A0ABR1IKT5_9AGAR
MDAVLVTRALGLHYLWVDAFCIIQDSEEDKAHEVKQIRHTFHNAYLTIIAACANTVYDGFLHERSPPKSPSTTLPFYCPDGILGTMHIRRGESAPANPIDKCAWCLEEHLLSPRKLVYSSHTLQYVCQTMHINVNSASNFVSPENGISWLPFHIFLPKIPAGYNPPEDNDTTWDAICTRYTRRTVTKAEDRLNALAGIAEQFQHIWPESRYIAGLWEHHLPGCLLWENFGESQCHQRPAQNLAPSWSWASTNGEVTTDFLLEYNEGILCSQDTIQVNVVAAHPMNPYGSVKHGFIGLEVILKSALWHPGLGILLSNDIAYTALQEWIPSEQDKIGDVVPDTLETQSWKICNVQLAVMRNTGYSLRGLVLVPATATAIGPNSSYTEDQFGDFPTFRRVGFFRARTVDKPELAAQWLHSKQQRIRII